MAVIRFLNPDDEFVAEQVAILLRGIRKKAQLSQETVGHKCGVTQERISQIESGKYAVDDLLIARFMKACGYRPLLIATKKGMDEHEAPRVYLTPHIVT